MTATVRGFCAQVYEYVKSDMESDTLDDESYSSPALEHNAEIAAARLGLQEDPQLRADSMRMMEATGVLPVLLFKRQAKTHGKPPDPDASVLPLRRFFPWLIG